MKRFALVFSLLLTTAVAQTPVNLPAYSDTFTSSLTRGFYFQCPVACVVTGLEVPNEQNQPNQVVEVIDFGLSAPPAFAGTVVGTSLFYDNTTASGTLIPTSIPLVAGTWYGVLGACNPSQGSSTSYNSYAPRGPFVTDILGNAVTIARLGTQTGLAASGPTQPCWSEDAGPIGRVYVHIAEPNQDPDCSNAAPSLGRLWPPNHQFVGINVLGVTDPDNDPITITIDSIFQDEVVAGNGQGAGNTLPDGAGVGTDTAAVRAERNGNRKTPGNGRVYTIRFTASDGRGGTCSGVVRVCVPHSVKSACVDDGELYDSTIG